MRSFTFDIELERDEDGYRAFFPAWESEGASTWGATEREALGAIEEVLGMMLEEFADEGRLDAITQGIA
jgi:predicted RNase H-like HicB family nuclease